MSWPFRCQMRGRLLAACRLPITNGCLGHLTVSRDADMCPTDVRSSLTAQCLRTAIKHSPRLLRGTRRSKSWPPKPGRSDVVSGIAVFTRLSENTSHSGVKHRVILSGRTHAMPDRLAPSAQQQLLAPLDPNESALTPLFQSHIDESMLREIAASDYGWRADECYQALQPVLKTGVTAPDDFNVREVLELIRWSEPDDPKWSPGGYGLRGHWMRLFACSELVRLAANYPDYFSSECDTLAQLISSAIRTRASRRAPRGKPACLAVLDISGRYGGPSVPCFCDPSSGRAFGTWRRTRALAEIACEMGGGRGVSRTEGGGLAIFITGVGRVADGLNALSAARSRLALSRPIEFSLGPNPPIRAMRTRTCG